MLLIQSFFVYLPYVFEQTVSLRDEFGIIENVRLLEAKGLGDTSAGGNGYGVARFHALHGTNVDAGRRSKSFLGHMLRLAETTDPGAQNLGVQEGGTGFHFCVLKLQS